MYPDFKFEQELWNKGKRFIVGCDEVGRGSLAGPVVTGAVIFKSEFKVENLKFRINDSKKLTQKQREYLDKWIRENALSFAIGIGTVPQINKRGIVPATNIAYRKAIQNLSVKPEFALLDAFFVPFIKSLPKDKQIPIIKGDNLSISIAAASIIAKVYRDELMTELSKEYIRYAWDRNKGYGTKEHIAALKDGTTKHHRSLFIRNI